MDPSVHRYNDFFTISKGSGVFKQCLDKSNRDECGCTEYQVFSSSPNDTDCNRRVLTAYFDRLWFPKVQVYLRGEKNGLLNRRFSIREVNGRTDWCVTSKFSVVFRFWYVAETL